MQEELEQKSKGIITKLLDWNDEHKAPDLSEIEEILLKLREEMGQEFADSILKNQENAAPLEKKFNTCGKEMRNKGQ